MKRKDILQIIAAVVIFGLVMGGIMAYDNYKKSLVVLPFFTFDKTSEVLIKSLVPGNRVGEFSFQDQQGRTITQANVANTIYVADYFFVQCPGICKKMSSELERVYREFEQEPRVKILSHTAKPEEDSTQALMAYAQMHGVKDHNKWLFLTGEKKALYVTARNQYFIVNDKGDGGDEDFIHTERFVLVDKNNYIRGYYDGTDSVEVSKLIGDIRVLLKE
ncbi:MAG: SCO family protein [Cytophagales bacterium]|nr:SCO family protein [Cytophagales bacterium]